MGPGVTGLIKELVGKSDTLMTAGPGVSSPASGT